MGSRVGSLGFDYESDLSNGMIRPRLKVDFSIRVQRVVKMEVFDCLSKTVISSTDILAFPSGEGTWKSEDMFEFYLEQSLTQSSSVYKLDESSEV